MLKGHPRGLLVAFFANMGERFGFYTMMAILVYFLQAKYGLSGENAGYIYAVFYFLIYGLALVGGFIADRTRNYKGVIQVGIIIMLIGYLLMAYPKAGLIMTLTGLFTIAFGNGLFKGNLQAVVGQMYDDPQYAHLRDSAYSIFYMGINIGAFFAPSAATGIRNWWLSSKGYGFDAELPSLAHQYLKGTLADISKFQELATKVMGAPVTDLATFAQDYIRIFSTGYNYAFAIAAVAMLVSLLIYVLFKSKLPDVRKHGSAAGNAVPEMSKEEEKQRLIVLGLVFLVVIFFWMSFHQNGLALTFFARDYTVKEVSRFSNLFFNIFSFLSVIAAIMGVVFLVGKEKSGRTRIIGALLLVIGGYLTYHFYQTFPDSNPIAPEKFQHFNPIFIVFLTPVVVWYFDWLNKNQKSISTPRKIGIGMVIAASAFVILMIGSFGLKSQKELAGLPSPDRVSEYWLISTYFVLTIAELFLSPMGISFVSKVAPPRFQGLMQGGWLGATALGNQLLFVGSLMYANLPIWMVWMVFSVICLIAAAFIFSIMKKLERVAG